MPVTLTPDLITTLYEAFSFDRQVVRDLDRGAYVAAMVKARRHTGMFAPAEVMRLLRELGPEGLFEEAARRERNDALLEVLRNTIVRTVLTARMNASEPDDEFDQVDSLTIDINYLQDSHITRAHVSAFLEGRPLSQFKPAVSAPLNNYAMKFARL